MNVLSLFDGISCAYQSLQKANIEIKSYYACEIDKNAIKVSQKNHPDIIQLGDVKTVTKDNLPTIDLLIGGSPCQDLSIGKKDRKGLEGERSGLFWEYVKILKECNPKYFILENVASMPQKDKQIITDTLGVEPVMFDASLVSAQSRKRYFWTNIKFDLPEDKQITLKDILQPNTEVDERFITKHNSYSKNSDQPKKKGIIQIGYYGNTNGQALRIYDTEGKSSTSGKGYYVIGRDTGRRLNEEGKREDDNVSLPITRRIELRNDEKTNTLTSVQKDNLVVGCSIRGRLQDGKLDVRKDEKLTTAAHSKLALVKDDSKIRKLTPIECERLMGLPDNYTEGISLTNRYKCLGNAFHVDVVSHILSNIK